MPDNEQQPLKPEPLSLAAFAESLYHGERANNNFKFLKNVPEQELPGVLQNLLKVIGDAIDERKAFKLCSPIYL